MKHKCIYLVLIFSLFLTKNGVAQYNYQQIDNSYGLSNSCINSIYQDADNLVWFATWDGLNYYDGNNIHVFNYEKTDINKNSIASNVAYQITGDKDRCIWIGTVEGLSKFDKNTGNFSNYFYSRSKAISNGYIVAVNNKDEVYAARKSNYQILRYDRESDTFSEVKLQLPANSMLIKILFDGKGNLWVLLDNGTLEVFKPQSNGFSTIKNYSPEHNVDNVFYCNGRIFFSTKANMLFGMDADFSKEKITDLPHEAREMSLFKDHYLFAWSSKGVGEYDASFKPLELLNNEVPVLQTVRVTSLMCNNDGLLWIGTDGNGVMKVTRKENYFGIVKQQANGQPFHIPVRAFCEIDNELWIGTKGNGIITLKNWDKNNVSFSGMKSFHTYVELLDNCVYAIEKGKDGLVYIGSDAPGVTLYDVKTKRFIKWSDIKGSNQYPYFGSVHCILNDRDSSVWLGLNDNGLIHFKLQTDEHGAPALKYFKQYKYNGNDRESENGPGNNVIYSLANGSDNRLWVGCRYGGLSLFDKKTEKFKTLKAFSYEGSLSNNDILSLYLDDKNTLWVGTSFGLNWVNEKTAGTNSKPKFEKLFVDNGLPNNTVHAISEDNTGNIWISTNKGLAKITPGSLKIVQYKESDGLQSDEFSDNAVWKNNAGVLFFGGIYGFNYFLPENIHIKSDQPPVLLTDLRFNGKNAVESGLIVLGKNGPVSKKHFVLKPNENYFELNIEPVTYSDAQKCQFAYKLENDDKDWHYMQSHDKIIYNQLSPGTYALKIKWSNGEGVWTAGIAAFSVTVKQYFWLTPLAFIFYTLALVTAFYLYARYRKNRFMMRQELKMEHMLREKDENLHQEQLNFFTNIAHELQTPLTLILGSLERYLFKNRQADIEQQGGNFLSIVKQEASRLHYLIQQLLEFRRAEAGYLENHYSYVNISALLTNIASLFAPLVEEKELDFSWHIQPDIEIWTDKDKVEKIVFNLLSNAFKHSAEKQYIVFNVNALKESGQLEIIVANSGCKLTDVETERLFDRFFVVDGKQNNKSSTGIGLAFTQQIVTLLDGAVNAKCANDWITFNVLLPLDFVPEQQASVIDCNDKGENASYIVSSMTTGNESISLAPIAVNNKKSLIKSFEQENKKSILVVEDDQLIRYLLKDILHENYIIYEAGTGLEAIQVIKRTCPDLIISDIMMPDMNGLELCNIIKNTTETCHIPFVILSARTAIEHKTEGYSCGADAYIPKPFQTEHLLVRVQKLLEYREKMHLFFKTGQNKAIAGLVNELDENDRNFIKKVTKVIEDNMDMELDSEFLEKALSMSRLQLYRKIKTTSDMTPSELIRHLRLQKASALLKNTDLTVSEIFYSTGFNNKTYFFREFKKMFNYSPNDYRQKNRLPDFKKN